MPEENIEIVKKLCRRGIVSSICSKNDFDNVKSELDKYGIFEYFVFPHINWDDKGKQIKDIIEECRLRADNVLYIDDNFHNLQEALHLCKNLQTEGPQIIPQLLSNGYLKGKDDPECSRLKHFKTLEKKSAGQKSFSSNTDFLYHSNIKVQLCDDCSKHAERIEELINRTNQLNFTKKRINILELQNILQDKSYKNLYVQVQDNYGDYGIVGFVSVKNNILEHFLFSCRTIGMGIEQWVYSELGFPTLEKKGETIGDVNSQDRPAWINQATGSKQFAQKRMRASKKSVLIHGGCDLSQMEPYLSGIKVSTEFNYRRFHRDHSVFAFDYLNENLSRYKKDIIENVPFIDKICFETRMFENGYDYIVISVLMDYAQGVYSLKACPEIKIAYGNHNRQINVENTVGYSTDELKWFLDNFDFAGRTSESEFLEYLRMLRKNISQNAKIIFINGCEVLHENKDEEGFIDVHKKLNRVLDDFAACNENVYLLDVRKIVTKREHLTNNIRHYTRDVYFKMAEELIRIINEDEEGSSGSVVRNKIWIAGRNVRRMAIGIVRRREIF